LLVHQERGPSRGPNGRKPARELSQAASAISRPRFEQGSTGGAHSLQNLAPSWLAKPHFGHCIVVDRLGRAHVGLTCAHGLVTEI